MSRRGNLSACSEEMARAKTTCLDAIIGLTKAASGQVRLNGRDLTNSPIDHRAALGLAYPSQEGAVFSGLTVEENILLALELAATSPASRAGRLEKLLADFKLVHERKQSATSISGGERRRCEVARAMALDPAIRLLDEPFRGLDPMSIVSTKHLVSELRSHVGVLISGYDLQLSSS